GECKTELNGRIERQAEEANRSYAQERRRCNRCERACGARLGEVPKSVNRSIWSGLANYRRNALYLVVEGWPGERDARLIQQSLYRVRAPRQNENHEQQVRRPGPNHLWEAIGRARGWRAS